jgi:7,8-dihydro-6-hydroxymethylpterin dimethyltransferase
MHMTASLTKWYEEKGRHEIFAGGKKVNLVSAEHSLKLNAADVAAGIQHDLDSQGIAKTAREEKIRKRDANIASKAAEDAKMAKLYREVILKEKPVEAGFVPLGNLTGDFGIKPATPVVKKEAQEEVSSFGD